MKCPELSELPSPPPGREGFPWTEGSRPLPERTPEGTAWPRLSVVTPSYQQAAFLEETIRSVLLQGHPDLEYWVVDGGSTDGSVEIIEKYAPWLAGWVSERDQGQTDAINKGLRRVTGQVVAYLNSDDVYARDAFHVVASQFTGPAKVNWLIGVTEMVDEVGAHQRFFQPTTDERLSRWVAHAVAIPQPSTFLSRAAFEKAGEFDVSFSRSMDQEYWARLAVCGFRPRLVPQTLAKFRLHGLSKTCGAPPTKFFEEDIRICQKYMDRLSDADQRYARGYIDQTRAYVACWDVYKELPNGPRRAGRALVKLLAHNPGLLRQRVTWGLVRRLLTPGGLQQLAGQLNLARPR